MEKKNLVQLAREKILWLSNGIYIKCVHSYLTLNTQFSSVQFKSRTIACKHAVYEHVIRQHLNTFKQSINSSKRFTTLLFTKENREKKRNTMGHQIVSITLCSKLSIGRFYFHFTFELIPALTVAIQAIFRYDWLMSTAFFFFFYV